MSVGLWLYSWEEMMGDANGSAQLSEIVGENDEAISDDFSRDLTIVVNKPFLA